jgi:hypothetical protein
MLLPMAIDAVVRFLIIISNKHNILILLGTYIDTDELYGFSFKTRELGLTRVEVFLYIHIIYYRTNYMGYYRPRIPNLLTIVT